MSLLMFQLDDEIVRLVTDTLATGDDLAPTRYLSKVFPIPHMNMAIAMTGDAELGMRWINHIQRYVWAQDIDVLDQYVTKELVMLKKGLEEENGGVARPSALTIYHFGFPAGEAQPVRYFYRSGTGFQSERNDAWCFGARPSPEKFDLQLPPDMEGWISVAEQIRAEQYDGTNPEPVGIGGELYLTQIGVGFTTTARIHRFPNYDEDWETMLAAMR